MDERRIDPFEFYSTTPFYADQLFGMRKSDVDEVWILTRDDGTETEAVVPIEEYRRLKRLAAQRIELRRS
jgi:hypothetical protein